jgi:hypothetical protein
MHGKQSLSDEDDAWLIPVGSKTDYGAMYVGSKMLKRGHKTINN